MIPDYHYAVIGAGVVGLAVAAELAARGSLLVIEREWKFGQGTSSRNSEVVHAGLYYAPGSLKARLCVAGNRLIRELYREHGIGYRAVGKYIVAANAAEQTYLEWLKSNAALSGVTDVRWAAPEELREREPNVRAAACLFSPSSGIVDSHGLMSHLKTQAELAGADFVFNAEVVSIGSSISENIVGEASVSSPRLQGDHRVGYKLTVSDANGSETAVTAACVINCAGLYADRIAALAGMDVAAEQLDLLWTRGFYYTAEGARDLRIRHLIYPVPDKSLKSLGIHATVDLQGGVRFGPTAEYMEHKIEDYSFADAPVQPVLASVSRLLTGLEQATLHPVMTGIRPKLTRPGQPPRDFYIREERDRGLPGFVNLIGIESPGLTAAPAIAKLVGTLV